MVMEQFSLKGKVALIAGDGSGWGKALAQALAEAGADIALTVSRAQARELKEVVSQARRWGREVMVLPSDLTRLSRVQAMLDRAVARLGKVDILVNNAGVQFGKPLLEVTEREWRQAMETNLIPMFLCTQVVGRHMVARGWGRIINVASGLATRGLCNSTAYCATQGAILQFTRALALEWGPRKGVNVTGLAPVWLSEAALEEEAAKDPLARFIPMRRRGHPSELGPAAVYLASEASGFFNGQFIYVDGGVMSHP